VMLASGHGECSIASHTCSSLIISNPLANDAVRALLIHCITAPHQHCQVAVVNLASRAGQTYGNSNARREPSEGCNEQISIMSGGEDEIQRLLHSGCACSTDPARAIGGYADDRQRLSE